jgi:hypothetical protein
MTLAPANAAIAIAHLDDDGFKFLERPIRQNVGADQWKADPPQYDFSQNHGLTRSWF